VDSTTFYSKREASDDRRAFYDRLRAQNAAPLWEVLGDLVRTDPRTACVPTLWRYDEIRPFIMEAGTLITTEEAERRVLILENPGFSGGSRVTQSLYAGLQLILPGEVAHSHRHATSALRFVLEGEGAYTAVDGERVAMKPGDLILTPSWTFHDHGNPGADPVVWLDGLDIPITNFFDASFAEHHPEQSQPVARREGDALARYGSCMLPLEYRPPRLSTPMVAYPYARSRDALERMAASQAPDPRHGTKMQYSNPATGGYPLPTIGAFLELLPEGFAGLPYRSTDATVFCVAEGSGSSTVGDRTFTWNSRDIFVVPSWQPVAHHARVESVLFSFSDRPAQKALGLWRQDPS
jgi:gentisate 1,2-dioxygenase